MMDKSKENRPGLGLVEIIDKYFGRTKASKPTPRDNVTTGVEMPEEYYIERRLKGRYPPKAGETESAYNMRITKMVRQVKSGEMTIPGMADGGMAMPSGVNPNSPPPGAMEKEVADDVPAKLSEGEYVVPAAVVRFYGVDKFEKMTQKAMETLQEMEQRGRIKSPQPKPQPKPQMSSKPDFMKQPVEAANGGMVQSGFKKKTLQDGRTIYVPVDAMGNELPMQMGNKAIGGNPAQTFDDVKKEQEKKVDETAEQTTSRPDLDYGGAADNPEGDMDQGGPTGDYDTESTGNFMQDIKDFVGAISTGKYGSFAAVKDMVDREIAMNAIGVSRDKFGNTTVGGQVDKDYVSGHLGDLVSMSLDPNVSLEVKSAIDTALTEHAESERDYSNPGESAGSGPQSEGASGPDGASGPGAAGGGAGEGYGGSDVGQSGESELAEGGLIMKMPKGVKYK